MYMREMCRRTRLLCTHCVFFCVRILTIYRVRCVFVVVVVCICLHGTHAVRGSVFVYAINRINRSKFNRNRKHLWVFIIKTTKIIDHYLIKRLCRRSNFVVVAVVLKVRIESRKKKYNKHCDNSFHQFSERRIT